MTSKEKCECGHDLHDGERCRTAISVLPMKQCTCRWSRPAAWQNAAESLPAAPEQESCQHCGLPIRKTGMDRVRNEWEHLDGMSYCKGASTYAWPVAHVEAKEKERCEFCQLFAPLHSSTCFHWDGEPKPTSPVECNEQEFPSSIPSNCQKCGETIWGEGWNPNTGIRYFSHVPKPQPDSSSISTEQTFEEWWDKSVQPDYFRDLLTMAKQAWNAAKGQSNGR